MAIYSESYRCQKCNHQGKTQKFQPIDLFIQGMDVVRFRCPECHKVTIVRFVLSRKRQKEIAQKVLKKAGGGQ